MTPCTRSPITCAGCHLASTDLLLLELPSSRSCPSRRERRRVYVSLHVAERELRDGFALLRLPVCAVGVE